MSMALLPLTLYQSMDTFIMLVHCFSDSTICFHELYVFIFFAAAVTPDITIWQHY